ncbi:MAG: iron-containing alcohol dehydrogenase, partial [Eubacteriales bacterium]|nr:iron-containing alcohol dehydrogenase [Eubacteriales bacterium]
YVVSTIAASGSDIDCAGVIMNEDTQEKEVFGASACSPKVTVLDPTYTFSVPAKYTAAGTADMMMHILEDYLYREGDSTLSNRMMEAVLKTMIENGPKALADPEDYDARANLMWAASLATSGMLCFGRGSGSATIHWIEGVVCGYYNTTHGEVLAQLLPVWMEHIICEKNVVAFSELATNVFGVIASEDLMDTARAGIEAVKHFFFEELKIPSKLSAGGVTQEYFKDIAKKAMSYPLTGGNVDLTEEDVYEILTKAL